MGTGEVCGFSLLGLHLLGLLSFKMIFAFEGFWLFVYTLAWWWVNCYPPHRGCSCLPWGPAHLWLPFNRCCQKLKHGGPQCVPGTLCAWALPLCISAAGKPCASYLSLSPPPAPGPAREGVCGARLASRRHHLGDTCPPHPRGRSWPRGRPLHPLQAHPGLFSCRP